MKGKVNIYGCGGAGIKLAAKFANQVANLDKKYIADINPIYVDTSLSNIHPLRLKEESCYIFEGCDGSGSKRDQHAGLISSKINQVIEKFAPSSPLNIIISSASGGSGSVIGSYLASCLLATGAPTIYILIQSNESLIAMRNSIQTIRGLDNIARNQQSPLVTSMHSNDANTNNSQVDSEVLAELYALAILSSRQSPGLDTEDLRNWIQFNRVSNVEAQLASLDIVNSVDAASEVEYPVSIASLVNGTTTIGATGADYFCDGPVPHEEVQETHFVINVGDPALIVADLERKQKDMMTRASARPKTTSLASGHDSGDAAGLLF